MRETSQLRVSLRNLNFILLSVLLCVPYVGLRIQGWELAVRDKSAPELRLEYILLKQKAKEAEREHLLQPSTELSCGIDMTDFFDRYLKVCIFLSIHSQCKLTPFRLNFSTVFLPGITGRSDLRAFHIGIRCLLVSIGYRPPYPI